MNSIISAGALLVLVSCTAPSSTGRSNGRGGTSDVPLTIEQREQIDDLKRKSVKVTDDYRGYIHALILFADRDEKTWEESYRTVIQYTIRYQIPLSDPDRALLEKARRGKDSEGVQARGILHTQGITLDLLRAYERQDHRAWDVARTEILKLGDDSTILLVDTLLQRLMSETFLNLWDDYRMELARIGRPTIQPVTLMVHTLGHHSEPNHACDLPKGQCQIKGIKSKLIQCLMVLTLSTDPSRESLLKDFTNSPHVLVRESFAEALGNVADPTNISSLETLSHDPEWQVRLSAADALGKVLTDKSGRLLLDILNREKDDGVLSVAVRSLGMMRYEPAVPVLLRMLKGPYSGRVKSMAEASLKAITGKEPGDIKQ